MISCLETCKKLGTSCPIKECRYWIDYEAENNCVFETVSANGPLTLREAAERLGMSYVRVKQIQDKALQKIKKLF
tara:strand:+ start:516 stop:740 length:225 start_codon:yes stop_codon:yes gene_type:complete